MPISAAVVAQLNTDIGALQTVIDGLVPDPVPNPVQVALTLANAQSALAQAALVATDLSKISAAQAALA